MARALFRSLRRASSSSSLAKFPSSPSSSPLRPLLGSRDPPASCSLLGCSISLNPEKGWWGFRELSYGTVNLVISDGKPKFETHEVDPPKKDKWKTKKRLKMQRKREKQKRKAANRKDPRRLTVKRKRGHKYADAGERLKCKIERAKIKEALLVEKLKKYEVPKVQGPEVQPHSLTGEERFFMKKMAQKGSNYVPVGRRGIFGGVILNMHMHWKKHETVKVFCKPCKPGQVREYAREIARLSGGIPLQIIGDDTIIFYRGKNYVQPEVMSPIETLSKKKALEKSKYEQSLESARHFIAVSEKELELYYRHVALYGNSDNRNPVSAWDGPIEGSAESAKAKRRSASLSYGDSSPGESDSEADSTDQDLPEETGDEFKDDNLSSIGESDSDDHIQRDWVGEDSSDNDAAAVEPSPSSVLHSSVTELRDNQNGQNRVVI